MKAPASPHNGVRGIPPSPKTGSAKDSPFESPSEYTADYFKNIPSEGGKQNEDGQHGSFSHNSSSNKLESSYNLTSDAQYPTSFPAGEDHDGDLRGFASLNYVDTSEDKPSVPTVTSLQRIPFFGRQPELETLQKAVERVSLEWMENPPEVAWVTGSPGIGKSTLVKHALDSKQAWKAFVCRSSCEQARLATKPFAAVADALNDLCLKLLQQQSQGDSKLWKGRLEEALGGEGPLLCTIAPKLCFILQIPPLNRRSTMEFNANTKWRLDRLGFAIRDFLQAVSEYHPLVMMVDNLHWADADSLKVFQDLLSTKSLQNFLFIGIHDEPGTLRHSLTKFKHFIKDKTETRVTKVKLDVFALERVEEMLCSVFLDSTQINKDAEIDRIQDLSEIVYALTKGNTLWMTTLLALLQDKKLLTYEDSRWDWNRKKIKKELKVLRESGDKALLTISGSLEARIEGLPKKIGKIVQSIGVLGLSYFDVTRLDSVLQAVHQKEKKSDPDSLVQSQEELNSFCQKACQQGIFKKLAKGGYYKFSHDLMREAAASLVAKKQLKKGQPSVRFRMGISLAALCMETKGEERDRFKLLAAHNLHSVVKSLTDGKTKAKIARLHLESAEIAISKTAFRTAIELLDAGIGVLSEEERWNKENYETTLRSFLSLARMRWACGKLLGAKAACKIIVDNAATVKDSVLASHTILILLLHERSYDEALRRVLDVLKRLGEVFPQGESASEVIVRETEGLRTAVRKRNNKELVNPKKMTDKKALDVLQLLATLVEIAPMCKKTRVCRMVELAMIRMLHLSLKLGFSRQYPLAFALFGSYLAKRGFFKDAYRVGQVAERVASPKDFYGGQSVALFHWHISHWHRTYQRCLEPVLSIYNSQVDSGDFQHVDFSVHTYVQYHIASGFDLERLSDNLHLFAGLYDDYGIDHSWHVLVAQHTVANLMGETANPLFFFGDTVDRQEKQLEYWKKQGQMDALEYFHWLRCYISFFFHDIEIMEESLEALTQKSSGIWVPWRVFFECYVEIKRLAHAKGKKKKEIRDAVNEKLDLLTDWYNDGAPNPNAMVSILDAECLISSTTGKNLSSIKVETAYDDAINSAAEDRCLHFEAFACERAGLYFRDAGAEGSAAKYLSRAHSCYERWHAVAKVIDIESKFADILKISTSRQRTASAYIDHNMNMEKSQGKQIGGGHSEPKAINLPKLVTQAGRYGKKGYKKSSRTVKGLFKKKEKADPAPWGLSSRSHIQLQDEAQSST